MRKNEYFCEGATRVTYIKKEDDRRSKYRCIHLKDDKSNCLMRVGRCMGSSHCSMYEEKWPTRSESEVIRYTSRAYKENRVIINQKIKHKKHGMGRVKSIKGEAVEITFESGESIKLNLDICLKNNIIEIIG